METRIDTEKLLDRVNLIELCKQAGAEFSKGKTNPRSHCPLHLGSNNPTTFSVYTEGGRQLWKCHTRDECGGGDAIHFVMKWKRMDFLEAVKWLATWTNVRLEELNLTPQAAKDYAERERRRDVLELAARFYTSRLKSDGAQAVDYLRRRGFNDATIWGEVKSDTEITLGPGRFGYTDGNGLLNFLKEKNADLDLARALGLVRADGFDFTANADGRKASPAGWLVYIHRTHGRVDSLSARALDPIDPKDKSRNLPGERQLYRAEVAGSEALVLVEGQADVESLRQLGFSAWALCGKALSESDLSQIRKRKPVYLALDSDEAGQASLPKLANAMGGLTMIAPALTVKDFNEWLQGGAAPADIEAHLSKSQPWISLAIAKLKSIPEYELDERITQIAVLIADLPEAMRNKYLKLAETASGIPAKDIKAKMKTAQSDRLLADIKEGEMRFLGEPLGNFSLLISRELSIDDGLNTPDVRYAVQGRLANGEPLDEREVDADEFESMAWLNKWGARLEVYVPPSRRWLINRAARQLSREGLKREREYTFTGWTTVNGKRAFLSAGGAITADGCDPSVRVNLGNNRLNYYHLPEPPQGAALRLAVKASLSFLQLAPLRVAAPLWAAMYLAPLTELFPLNAVIWVYGKTQSLKSSFTVLALAHFGEQFVEKRNYKPPKDWLSTLTDLEHAMFVTKDTPLVIDDYAPQQTAGESRSMEFKANQVIRSVGNRSARGRANADLSERLQRPPRGVVLSTAEKPLTVQSIVGRMIYVTVAPGDIDVAADGDPGGKPIDRAQESAGAGGGIYAQAMAGYVQWLAADWERLVKEKSIEYERASQYARNKLPSTFNRLADYYAALFVGAQAALEYAVQVGAETPEKAKELERKIGAALLDLLASQHERVAGQSPVRRMFQALENAIIQKKAYLEPRTGESDKTPALNATLVGWYGYDSKSGVSALYLNVDACIQVAKRHWSDLGDSFDVTNETLQREIAQDGLLARRGKRGFAIKEWVSSAEICVTMLAVDAQKAADFTETSK